MKQIYSVIVLIISFSALAKIDYYNTTKGGSSLCGDDLNFYGVDVGVEGKEFAEKYIGEKFVILHGANKTDIVSVERVGCDRVFNDSYPEPEGFMLHTPILVNRNRVRYKGQIAFTISSKHKVENYRRIKTKEQKKEDGLKYKEMVIEFADRYKKFKWFTAGMKFEIIQYEKSDDGFFSHLYTSYGQFLIYKDKVIYANSNLGKHNGSGIVDLYGQIDVDGKTYLIIRTDVKGMGTLSSSTGLFLFENGEIKKYVAPKFMPTFFGHGFSQK